MNQPKKHKNIAIAAGGTGGHIFPALAIADYLATNSDYRPTFITDDRGINFVDKTYNSLRRVIIPTSRFTLGLSLFSSIPNFIKSIFKLTFELHSFKPVAVIGFGGYASFPALLASTFLRIPIVLHESNAVMGRTNKYFLPFCKKIMLSFAATSGIKDKYRYKIELTGTPVRKNILQSINLDQKADAVKILIIGGSQGSKIMSEVIPQAITALPLKLRNKLTIWHQARPEQVEHTVNVYNKANLKDFTVAPFFPDEPPTENDKSISALMQQADFIIARSGAGTISEITTLGKPAIFIPFAAAKDNHQFYNAKDLLDTQAAVMIEEGDSLLRKLTETLELFITDNHMRNTMGNKALTGLHKNSPASMLKIIKALDNLN